MGSCVSNNIGNNTGNINNNSSSRSQEFLVGVHFTVQYVDDDVGGGGERLDSCACCCQNWSCSLTQSDQVVRVFEHVCVAPEIQDHHLTLSGTYPVLLFFPDKHALLVCGERGGILVERRMRNKFQVTLEADWFIDAERYGDIVEVADDGNNTNNDVVSPMIDRIRHNWLMPRLKRLRHPSCAVHDALEKVIQRAIDRHAHRLQQAMEPASLSSLVDRPQGVRFSQHLNIVHEYSVPSQSTLLVESM